MLFITHFYAEQGARPNGVFAARFIASALGFRTRFCAVGQLGVRMVDADRGARRLGQPSRAQTRKAAASCCLR